MHASISYHLTSYAVLPHSTVFFLSLIIFLIDACGWGCRIGFIHHIIPPTNHRVTTVSVPNIIPLLRGKVMTERDYLYDADGARYATQVAYQLRCHYVQFCAPHYSQAFVPPAVFHIIAVFLFSFNINNKTDVPMHEIAWQTRLAP